MQAHTATRLRASFMQAHTRTSLMQAHTHTSLMQAHTHTSLREGLLPGTRTRTHTSFMQAHTHTSFTTMSTRLAPHTTTSIPVSSC
jgi:hypothetical protein